MAFRPGKCLLRHRLREVDMTPTSLAERTNLSRSMISHYMAGRKLMNLAAAKTIAEAIGCSMESLYEWVHVRNSSE